MQKCWAAGTGARLRVYCCQPDSGAAVLTVTVGAATTLELNCAAAGACVRVCAEWGTKTSEPLRWLSFQNSSILLMKSHCSPVSPAAGMDVCSQLDPHGNSYGHDQRGACTHSQQHVEQREAIVVGADTGHVLSAQLHVLRAHAVSACADPCVHIAARRAAVALTPDGSATLGARSAHLQIGRTAPWRADSTAVGLRDA